MNGIMVILLGLSFFGFYKFSVNACMTYNTLASIDHHKKGIAKFFTKVMWKYAYTGVSALFPLIGILVMAVGCGMMAVS